MNKNEIAKLLCAYGITASIKQAQLYLKNKSDNEIKDIIASLKRRAVYSLLND